MSISPTLPPSARDFLAYERLIIDGFSTRQAAEELRISQTRVRQIVRRVADWLAEHLPAYDETRQAAQIRLAQHIASERLHRYTCDCERAWQQTRETKYVTLLIRLLTAQSKLPAHPHTLLSLAPDDNVVPSLREGQEVEQIIRPDTPQPTTAAESRVGPACEATPGPPMTTRSVSEDESASIPNPPSAANTPPTLARSASEGKPASTPQTASVAALVSSEIQNPKSQIQNSSPPPTRACSPPQNPASIANRKNSPACLLSPSTETSSTSNQDGNNSARQAFLSPAHLLRDAAEAPAITELKLTPQSIGLTTKNHSTPRERRRLQRLLSKK